MIPGPGWLFFTGFLLLECLVVLVLIAPMPSNSVRGAVLEGLMKLSAKKPVAYGSLAMVALSGLYFYESLQTIFSQPSYMLSCEQRELLFFSERNAYATGLSILLFLVLNRMLEIQKQLYGIRQEQKKTSKTD